MQYKSDIWYKIGKWLIVGSVVLMAVTFVLMGFGVDGAIIWFFAACPFLVAGFWIIRAIRGRYEEAALTGRKREPMFSFFRDLYDRIYSAVSEKGAAKTVLTVVLSLGLAAVLVCGWFCFYYRYCSNGILKDPKYAELSEKYSVCEVEWNFLYSSGNKEAASKYYASSGMENTLAELSKFEKQKSTYEKNAGRADTALVIALAVEGTLAVMSAAAVLVIKGRRGKSTKEGGTE